MVSIITRHVQGGLQKDEQRYAPPSLSSAWWRSRAVIGRQLPWLEGDSSIRMQLIWPVPCFSRHRHAPASEPICPPYTCSIYFACPPCRWTAKSHAQ